MSTAPPDIKPWSIRTGRFGQAESATGCACSAVVPRALQRNNRASILFIRRSLRPRPIRRRPVHVVAVAHDALAGGEELLLQRRELLLREKELAAALDRFTCDHHGVDVA